MKSAERRILALLRQLAERDTAVLSDRGGSARRLAPLVYVAELHGFRYGETHRVGRSLEVRVVRAETAPALPAAPGPEAVRAVRRLRDRIELDALSEELRAPVRSVIMTVCALFLGLLLRLGSGWGAALVGFALAEALFLGFLYVQSVRRRRLARRVR
ncbi:hypothetical protein [Streptomyces sp. NPDC005423]|uniref:hypothetical protein n=1 Tax=Streptomyces sp. NPDC005423 TaxID=3155343 RepID=UPI0033A444D7